MAPYEDFACPEMPNKAVKAKKMEACKKKVLHVQYDKLTAGVRSSDSWEWLKKVTMK